MKSFHKRIVVIIWLLIFPISLFSQQMASTSTSSKKKYRESGWAISAKLNTFGPGLEMVKSFGEKFSVRLGGNYFIYNYKGVYDNINVDAEAKFKVGAVSLLFDWYFAPVIHLTAGGFYNVSKESVSASPSNGFHVGNVYVSPERLGSISIDLEPNRFGPYFGIGFGRAISYENIVGFNIEFGALYHGKPSVGLKADGMIAPTANPENEKIIEDNISGFFLYPVVTVQLSFRIY